MPRMPTPAEYLASLRSVVGRFAAPIDVGSQPDALLFALLEVSTTPDGVGVMVSVAADPVNWSTILYVSPQVLAYLDYADLADYQAAVSQVDPGFVHEDDIEVANDHVRWRSSAIYKLRLRRGVGNAVYREMIMQGWTLSVPTVGEIRISLMKRAPNP